jgi:general secretion pathway protein J
MIRGMATRSVRGFTLVELLVALFITAILFAMGYSALSQALNSRNEVEAQSARLSALQQAVRVIEQDFELMQPRPARDLLGNGFEAPLVVSQNAQSGATMPSAGAMAGQQGPALLSFTRGGWANPAGVPRAELQRVSYLLRDGRLIRQHLPVLDTTAATAVVERELLDQVEALSFRFMDESLTWSSAWPTAPMQSLPPTALLRARPVAVEVTLKLRDMGVVTRIIEVAG